MKKTLAMAGAIAVATAVLSAAPLPAPAFAQGAPQQVTVGGFLGIGEHFVALPHDSLKISDDKIVLPGGSKDQLKALPQFKYATK